MLSLGNRIPCPTPFLLLKMPLMAAFLPSFGAFTSVCMGVHWRRALLLGGGAVSRSPLLDLSALVFFAVPVPSPKSGQNKTEAKELGVGGRASSFSASVSTVCLGWPLLSYAQQCHFSRMHQVVIYDRNSLLSG